MRLQQNEICYVMKEKKVGRLSFFELLDDTLQSTASFSDSHHHFEKESVPGFAAHISASPTSSLPWQWHCKNLAEPTQFSDLQNMLKTYPQHPEFP